MAKGRVNWARSGKEMDLVGHDDVTAHRNAPFASPQGKLNEGLVDGRTGENRPAFMGAGSEENGISL